MYYHASPTPDITTLEPRVSNHGRPLLYFSEKRENVLVYLSNAIEKFCRETGFAHTGPWQKWGPYGFTQDGRLQIQEYYPNALVETYAGVPGYIYAVEDFPRADFDVSIPFAAVSETPVPVATTLIWRYSARTASIASVAEVASSIVNHSSPSLDARHE